MIERAWLASASAWGGRIVRMQRVDPIYKPVMVLAVVDLIEQGVAIPELVPLDLAVKRFDEILALAGVLSSRDPGRAFMPIFHMSSSSRTRERFWEFVKNGAPVQVPTPGSVADLLRSADEISVLDVLRGEAEQANGRWAIRQSVYNLLERDGRADCLAVLRAVDADMADVEATYKRLDEATVLPFILDDRNAATAVSTRVAVVRDRALRRLVSPLYDYACALCGLRLRWNHLWEVEAAHIKPRSLSGVDDVRNSLALCGSHHWAFDVGGWGALGSMEIVVASPSSRFAQGDDIEALRAFAGTRLRVPEAEHFRPHAEALQWHREQVFARGAA